MWQKLKLWTLPTLIAGALIAGSHITFLQAAPTTQQLQDFFDAGGILYVGIDSSNEFPQVFYTFENTNYYITAAPTQNSQASAHKEYIVYTQVVNGFPQVFQHNVLTGTTKQLSFVGSNMEPVAYEDKVVWQMWQDEQWHVRYYSGSTASTISNPVLGTAARPRILGDKIRYTQELGGTFSLKEYTISTATTTNLATGDEITAGWPSF